MMQIKLSNGSTIKVSDKSGSDPIRGYTKDYIMTVDNTRTFKRMYFSEDMEHAEILWDDSGRLIILGSYGNWTFYFSHIGDRTIEEFLSQTDDQYLGSKLLGNEYLVLDLESTVLTLKEMMDFTIADESKKQTEIHMIELLSDGDISFDMYAAESNIPDVWESGEYKVNPMWKQFVLKFWNPLVKPRFEEYILTN